ncbi:MAG: cupin domain-containing protein [Chloroflexi bacterium]|nr:cupin domain-containing protein [Chloroflexota bacterium]
MIKNFPMAEVVNLAEMVTYQPGQVVSRTVSQNKLGSLTLFAFPEGEGLSTHTTPADALVYILDGKAHIEIGDDAMDVAAGESVIMPANVPHALHAQVPFKMLLIIIKGD